MTQADFQNHLENALYGHPLLNPEEQRKYMGTFRERCYLTMTIPQMKKTENKANFVKELALHPDTIVLLNGAMDITLQSCYIKLIIGKQRHFTVVNDFVTNTPDSLGLVLTAKEAVNQKIIDIEEKYTETEAEVTQLTQSKKSFWQKLFHSEKQ